MSENSKGSWIGIAILMALLMYTVCNYAIIYEGISRFAVAGFVVLSLTLLTLIIYAWDTHRIANQQQQAYLTPTVSHAFNQPEWWGTSCEIFLTLRNHSLYDVKTLVTLNILVDGIKLNFLNVNETNAYQARSYWIMCPKDGHYEGHFTFGDILLRQNNINWPAYNDIEFRNHEVVFELSYTTHHNISNDILESMTYRYKFLIMTHMSPQGLPILYVHFIPMVVPI